MRVGNLIVRKLIVRKLRVKKLRARQWEWGKPGWGNWCEKHESEEILNEGNQYTALRIKKWTIFQLAVRGDWGLDTWQISNYLFFSRSFWEARHMLLSEYAVYAVHISPQSPLTYMVSCQSRRLVTTDRCIEVTDPVSWVGKIITVTISSDMANLSLTP